MLQLEISNRRLNSRLTGGEDRLTIDSARWTPAGRDEAPDEVRSDLQTRTTASDGRASLTTMAQAAEARGCDYLAVTDQSPAVRVAGGLDRKGFFRRRRAIDRWNARSGRLRIIAGAEVDILPDGSVDLDDRTRADLELVVASRHSALDLPRREQFGGS